MPLTIDYFFDGDLLRTNYTHFSVIKIYIAGIKEKLQQKNTVINLEDAAALLVYWQFFYNALNPVQATGRLKEDAGSFVTFFNEQKTEKMAAFVIDKTTELEASIDCSAKKEKPASLTLFPAEKTIEKATLKSPENQHASLPIVEEHRDGFPSPPPPFPSGLKTTRGFGSDAVVRYII